MSDAASDAQPQQQSNRAYGWLTVGLLTIAYIFSFIDRYVLGLLIEPIKADLGLTDTQIGLLLGPAFAIFYATMGLPLGWLADRKNRVKIVAQLYASLHRKNEHRCRRGHIEPLRHVDHL